MQSTIGSPISLVWLTLDGDHEFGAHEHAVDPRRSLEAALTTGLRRSQLQKLERLTLGLRATRVLSAQQRLAHANRVG